MRTIHWLVICSNLEVDRWSYSTILDVVRSIQSNQSVPSVAVVAIVGESCTDQIMDEMMADSNHLNRNWHDSIVVNHPVQWRPKFVNRAVEVAEAVVVVVETRMLPSMVAS